MTRWGTIAALFLLPSCVQHSSFHRPSSDLDEMFFYVEQDRRGEEHRISSDDKTAKKPTRVPQPALVDLDSVVSVQIQGKRAVGTQEILASGGQELIARKTRMQDVLGKLDDVIVARMKAVEAFEQRDDAAFISAKQAYGANFAPFIAALREIYVKGTPEYKALSNAAGDPTLNSLRALLQEELGAITTVDRAIATEAETRKSTLNLQAFLERPGKGRTPVHLRGYDTLPEGQLQIRDRSGLSLSPDEKQRLESQFAKTQQLATALNRVKRDEILLRDGMAEALPIVSPKLAAKVEEIKTGVDALKSKERLDELKKEFDTFVAKVKSDSANLVADTMTKMDALPTDLRDKLTAEVGPLGEALAILDRIKEVRDNSHANGRSEDLLGLLGDTTGIVKDLMDLKKKPHWPKKAAQDAKTVVIEAAKGIGAEAEKAIGGLIDSVEAKALFDGLNAYYVEVANVHQLVLDLLADLNLTTVPVAATPQIPEVIDVDLDKLEDTSLDLKRVAGQPGDLIVIKSTLRQAGRAVKTSEASLELTRYGWYGKLSASVVLIRPTSLSGGDDGFQFAPVLSWNQHYRPRPEENGTMASIARPLSPAFGLHAAFLPYDPDNDVAIGLGGTLSFWDDRLQFGAGYNLMSDSRNDGRIYFFVGSDLIGLLQSVGIGD